MNNKELLKLMLFVVLSGFLWVAVCLCASPSKPTDFGEFETETQVDSKS